MTGRNPARLLAPVALIVTVVALFMIVASGGGGEDDPETLARPTATATAVKGTGKATVKTSGPKTYRVKAGDTPSTIAEEAGVPLETLLELNPNLDPQALSPGQKLKLRP